MLRSLAFWMTILFSLSLFPAYTQDDPPPPLCSAEDLASSRLAGGVFAEVVSDASLTVYKDRSLGSDVVARLGPGAQVYVLSDPRCSDDLIWWPLRFRREFISGYAPEVVGGVGQLRPIFQTLDVPTTDTPITAANFGDLEPVAEAAYQEPVDLVWSPDGARLAISTPWAVWVHDIKGVPSEPRRLDPTVRAPWRMGALQFSRGGETLATVDVSDGDLHLWSLETDEHTVVDVEAEHYNGIAAISADLSMWATASLGGSISLWSAATGARLAVSEGHEAVGALAFSPDGDRLVSAGYADPTGHGVRDTSLRLWDTTTGEQLAVFDLGAPFDQANDPGRAITFSPDGTIAVFPLLVRGDRYQAVMGILNVGEMSYTTWSVVDNLNSLSFSPNGDMLVVTLVGAAYSEAWSDPFALLLLNAASGERLAELPVERLVMRAAFSPEGTLLATTHAGLTSSGSVRTDLISSGVVVWAVP
ncbi:MAG: hypothetical protein Kow00106_25850 [Anaerolineae bacterium]